MKPSKKSLGTLEVIFPRARTWLFPVERPVLSIGRNPENELTIDHPSVSRVHARLYYENGRWWVEDLNSRNGTFINRNRLPLTTKVEVPPGSQIQLGDVVIRFRKTMPPFLFWGLLGLLALVAVAVLLFIAFSLFQLLLSRGWAPLLDGSMQFL